DERFYRGGANAIWRVARVSSQGGSKPSLGSRRPRSVGFRVPGLSCHASCGRNNSEDDFGLRQRCPRQSCGGSPIVHFLADSAAFGGGRCSVRTCAANALLIEGWESAGNTFPQTEQHF